MPSCGPYQKISAPLKANTCSNATLSGTYASNQTGTLNGLPVAQVNRVVSDGSGNITGSGTLVVNGVVSYPIFTATYTVNADCTGTFTTSSQDLYAAEMALAEFERLAKKSVAQGDAN